MKKMTVFVTLAILIASIVVGSVLATSFDYGRQKTVDANTVNGSITDALGVKNNALFSALQAGDYNAYMAALNASDRHFMMQNLTEAQFNERATQFKELESERNVTMQYQTEIQDAIQAKDYTAWYTAETGLEKEFSITSRVTADNFDTYVAMHEAIDSGNYTQAKALAQEIGISEGIGGYGPNDFGHPNALDGRGFNETYAHSPNGLGQGRGHGR